MGESCSVPETEMDETSATKDAFVHAVYSLNQAVSHKTLKMQQSFQIYYIHKANQGWMPSMVDSQFCCMNGLNCCMPPNI